MKDALFDVLLGLAQDVAGGVGVSRASSPNGETYVFRNAHMKIIGVLRVLASGKFVVTVRSDHQKQGIGTTLLKAANEISAIDFSKSTYTQAGERLRDSYLKN